MGLRSYEEALATVLAACRPIGTERVPLDDAAGRVLAERLHVTTPVPAFSNSAMDGFAVRTADTMQRRPLPLDPPVPAGTAPPPLRPGHAAPIGTGGVLPEGADTIVPIEDARVTDGHVMLSADVRLGAFVRAPGSDLQVGPLPIAVGSLLEPVAGALLATVGATVVEVYRRPTVAVLATGAELVAPEREPGPAQIRNSNSTALAWIYRRLGADVITLGIAPDEREPLRALLEQALTADMVVTSAGVSVGERDLVRGTLAELGVEPVFWGIDLKPGKPTAFALAGNRPVISLPGNPASTLVCSALIAEPALRALCGWRDPGPVFEWAAADGSWPATESRLHAVRCALSHSRDGASVRPTGDQRSHRLGSMVGAGALALVEAGRAVRPGDHVRITRV